MGVSARRWKAGSGLFLAPLLWLILGFITPLMGATVGVRVPFFGQATMLAYDAAHRTVFISNTTQNRVEVYSVDQAQLLSPISVPQPYGMAVIPQYNLLLVCGTQDTFLTLIDLTTFAPRGTVPITPTIPVTSRTPNPPPETPVSVVSLSGGTVLLSTSVGLQLVDLNARTTTPIQAQFPIPPNAELVTSGDGTVAFGQGSGIAFVYNPSATPGSPYFSAPSPGSSASVSFEQFRMSVNSRLLAANQGGSSFIIGDSLWNRQLFQTSAINPLAAPGGQLGGIAFSPDGSRVFAGYAQGSAGQIAILAAADLKVVASFQAPEAITGRMIVSPDGTRLYAISASGMTIVDLTHLPGLPSLQISKKVLFFSFQSCNRAPASQTVQITNSGGGTLNWTASASSPAITLDSTAGNGPASVQITVDPSGFSFRGTAPVAEVKISSDESVSGDQAILIVLNLTTLEQVGAIFPVEGFLTDILLDDARQRVYVVNSTKNQIEVFSIAQRVFLQPVPVGAMPKSIAISSDKKQLLVANLGTEYLTVIDADRLTPLTSIRIPFSAPTLPTTTNPATFPVTGTHPFSVAQAANGVTLVVGATVENQPRGTVYRIDPGATSAVAVPSLGLGLNAVSGLTFEAATANGALVFMAEQSGMLHLYDGGTGNFAITRSLANTTIAGNVAASADGSYYHAGTQLLNNVLISSAAIPSGIGGSSASLTGVAFSSGGASVYRGVRAPNISNTSPPPRIEKLDPVASKLVSSFDIAEALVPGSTNLLRAVARALVIDRTETALYGISDSGLIVIPLPGSAAGPGPQIHEGGVVNAASFAPAPAPVAPGSIAAIFGINLAPSTALAGEVPLPTSLGGACVTFNDVPAPLFYASSGQLIVQVPWELAGRSTAVVSVGSAGVASQPVTVNLASQAPGMFTTSGDGRGAGAIVHSTDFSLVSVSNPGRIGEFVSIFATGLGATDPRLDTGAAAQEGTVYRVATPTVTMGDVSAPVAFVGPVPGLVGVYQVNMRIPSNAPLGIAVPVTLTSGNMTSNVGTMVIIPAL